MSQKALERRFLTIRPVRVFRDMAKAYTLIITSLAIALWSKEPILWCFAAVIVGTQQYALQILLHDALHMRLLSSRSATDLIARIALCYPLISPLSGFRRKHLDHHRLLATPDDPDRYYHRTEDKATRWKFIMFATGIRPALFTLKAMRRSHQTVSRGQRKNRSRSNSTDWVSIFDWSMIVVVQLGIAAVLTMLGGVWAFPLLWFLPYFFLVYVAQSLRSFAEHAQPIADKDAEDQRYITYVSSPLERWFFAPNYMNYHAEHHMYPSVPYYHLPELRSYLEREGRMNDVEYRDSYLGFIAKFWRALPIDTSDSQAIQSPSAANV